MREQEVDGWQRLLARGRTAIIDVFRLLLAFILARIEKHRVVAREHGQHLLARGRGPASENRRDPLLFEHRGRQFRIARRARPRIEDHRLHRPPQQSARVVDLLDQHDQQLLQRAFARRQRSRQRMQNADLDRAGFQIGEIAPHRTHQCARTHREIIGRPKHRFTRICDLRDRRLNLRQRLADPQGDVARLITDPVELGELLFQHSVEVAVHRASRIDTARDRFDRVRGLLHGRLNAENLLAHLAGRFRGLGRKQLDLVRDHRKSASGRTRPRGLDGRVQGEQRGLPCDVLDQLDDDIDPLGRGRERLNGLIGMPKLPGRAFRRFARRHDLLSGLNHDVAHLARGLRDARRVAGGRFRALRGLRNPLRHVAIALGQREGGDADILARGSERRHDIVDCRLETPGDENAPGLAQFGFGRTAVAIDRDRFRIDQRGAQRFGGIAEFLHGAVANRFRQRGIAISARQPHKCGNDSGQAVFHEPADDDRAECSGHDPRLQRSEARGCGRRDDADCKCGNGDPKRRQFR